MSGNNGCTFVGLGFIALILGIAWLHDQTHQMPPMSDAEFQSLMTKRRTEQLQTCTKNTELMLGASPPKYKAEVIRKCANDDF